MGEAGETQISTRRLRYDFVLQEPFADRWNDLAGHNSLRSRRRTPRAYCHDMCRRLFDQPAAPSPRVIHQPTVKRRLDANSVRRRETELIQRNRGSFAASLDVRLFQCPVVGRSARYERRRQARSSATSAPDMERSVVSNGAVSGLTRSASTPTHNELVQQ
jgi:hypothetical protein